MTNFQIRTFRILTFILASIATLFLFILFFQNKPLTPLILHYIYSFGDYVANRNTLIYISAGIWSIILLNLYLAKKLKLNFKSLYDLIYVANIFISSFFLILSLQIFLNNI